MLTFLAATFAISQTSDVDVKRQYRRGAVGGGRRTFNTCARRRLELTNVHGGTSVCGGGTSASNRIWDTLF